MSENEAYVRSAWEHVHECDGSYQGYKRGTILLQIHPGRRVECDSWSAARAYTDGVIEEARKRRVEIQYLSEAYFCGPDGYISPEAHNAQNSILARLESAYAEHVRGLRKEVLR